MELLWDLARLGEMPHGKWFTRPNFSDPTLKRAPAGPLGQGSGRCHGLDYRPPLPKMSGSPGATAGASVEVAMVPQSAMRKLEAFEALFRSL